MPARGRAARTLRARLFARCPARAGAARTRARCLPRGRTVAMPGPEATAPH